MLYLNFFIGFLAVAHAAMAWPKPRDNIPDDWKIIEMTVVQHDATSKTHETVDQAETIFVDDISNKKIPHQRKTLGHRLGMNKVTQAVTFKAYFRTPPLPPNRDPSKSIELFLCFTLAPKVLFKWDPTPSGPNFQFNETRKMPNGTRKTYYKITAAPNSVFPIRLTIDNAKRQNMFRLLWVTIRTEGDPSGSTPQLVKMTRAEDKPNTLPWTVGTPRPIIGLMRRPLGKVRLSLAMIASDIEKYAFVSEQTNEFTLTGYFRPQRDYNRIVLSSKAHVKVNIHVPPMLEYNGDYTVYTLEARDGTACEMLLWMDSSSLYKIEVLGTLGSLEYQDFSLMMHDPENDFSSSGVELLIPQRDNTTFVQAVEQRGGTAEVTDFVDFRPRPISVDSSTSRTSSRLSTSSTNSHSSSSDTRSRSSLPDTRSRSSSRPESPSSRSGSTSPRSRSRLRERLANRWSRDKPKADKEAPPKENEKDIEELKQATAFAERLTFALKSSMAPSSYMHEGFGHSES